MEEEVIQEKEERLRNSMREVSEEMDMFTKEDEIENAATKLESIKKLFIAIKTKLRDTLKLIDKPANIALHALWEDNRTSSLNANNRASGTEHTLPRHLVP